MKKYLGIISSLEQGIENRGFAITDVIFRLFLVLFFADCVVNYFVHVPVFVAGSIVLLPLLFGLSLIKNRNEKFVLLFTGVLVIVSIINNIVHQFHEKNISDLVFILLFVFAYFFYRHNINQLKIINVIIFLLVSVFMLSVTLIKIDSDPLLKEQQDVKRKWVAPALKWEKKELDVIEAKRYYHSGIFRHSHIASYFFGFFALFFLSRFWKKKKIINLLVVLLSLVLLIYTGSRAMLFALSLSSILFLIRRKYWVYLIPVILILIGVILSIDYILKITEGTVFYQYFAFIKTSTENFTRLSRYRIWYSWWTEVRGFGFWDYIIGRTNYSGLAINKINLNYEIWFHNDLLNIFYSYGIFGMILYVALFVRIFIDNRKIIVNHFFIFLFYFTMCITAVINGFYFYFPIFMMYLFILMIKEQKQLK